MSVIYIGALFSLNKHHIPSGSPFSVKNVRNLSRPLFCTTSVAINCADGCVDKSYVISGKIAIGLPSGICLRRTANKAGKYEYSGAEESSIC